MTLVGAAVETDAAAAAAGGWAVPSMSSKRLPVCIGCGVEEVVFGVCGCGVIKSYDVDA